MPYSHFSKDKKEYWLHDTIGRNGVTLYYFARDRGGSVDLPPGKKVVLSSRSGIPMLKNKKI